MLSGTVSLWGTKRLLNYSYKDLVDNMEFENQIIFTASKKARPELHSDFHEAVPHLFLPKIRLEDAKKEIQAVFDRAKRCLTNAGFRENQITTKIIADAQSRAEAIIQEAREQDYGTIVIGRRGLSKVQEF